MLDIIEQTNGFDVKFAYRPQIVESIKKLVPGVWFNGVKKHWVAPLTSRDELFNWAKSLGFSPQPLQATEPIQNFVIDPLPDLLIDIPLKRKLFPYQGNGVAYALDKKQTFVGDEPGLGKTGQAIATVEGAKCRYILVICPATLKENWRSEIEDKWTSSKALILSDRVKSTWKTYLDVGMVKYIICNYESLKKYFVQEIKKEIDPKTGKPKPLRLNHIVFRESIKMFDAVIVDETHRCKDGSTQQTKFVMGITKGKEFILALTGTPAGK